MDCTQHPSTATKVTEIIYRSGDKPFFHLFHDVFSEIPSQFRDGPLNGNKSFHHLLPNTLILFMNLSSIQRYSRSDSDSVVK
jgi:hypothetical protein